MQEGPVRIDRTEAHGDILPLLIKELKEHVHQTHQPVQVAIWDKEHAHYRGIAHVQHGK